MKGEVAYVVSTARSTFGQHWNPVRRDGRCSLVVREREDDAQAVLARSVKNVVADVPLRESGSIGCGRETAGRANRSGIECVPGRLKVVEVGAVGGAS